MHDNNVTTSSLKKGKSPNLLLISIIYLAGIFMGAIDTGIVTPARTIIQNNLGVDPQTGIWMITIYTLAYAASIPIMGKLADKYGRKYIYIICITLFGLGSLMCGLSQDFGGFTFLLIARAVQAIGGGGIIPIATAEFGTSFPQEKRGMALGLVGGVYGIANIFGASAGSAILDIFGKDNWQFIFYINIPITIFIVVVGLFSLSNTKGTTKEKLDFLGIFTLTAMVLSLLYGLKNLDFFEILTSVVQTNVFPYLILFVVLLPVFIFIEKRADDPVMNLKYFTNVNIVITLMIAFVSGAILMGVIFVPQFSENALKIGSGSGGYFVIILGLFAGVGAPISGKLIDKFGVKIVLGSGFILSMAGALFLIFITMAYPSMLTVVLGLTLVGLGMGFTLGTPLNYMMLENTQASESNSALATLSLIRSIGTAIAPAIMIGFLAHAGASIQTNMMDLFPKEIHVPPMPYAQDITNDLNTLKENPQMKAQLENVVFPDLTQMETITINMTGDSDYELSPELLELLKTSDVTTITDHSKSLAEAMFSQMVPEISKGISGGITQGIDGIKTGQGQVKNVLAMVEGQKAEDTKAIEEKKKNVDLLQGTLETMERLITNMNSLNQGIPAVFDEAKQGYIDEIETKRNELEEVYQDTLNGGFKNIYWTVTISGLLAMVLLLFYRSKR